MSVERGGEERESEGDEVTGKENCEVEGEEAERWGQEQREIAIWGDMILRLAPTNREAWLELYYYLMRGVALDSDFVSKMLDISQPAAHRMMLQFRSAGLVGVAKIPNYAYGEGHQYLYYSQNKTLYGGGVAGYLRQRIYEDLTGREVAASLSPRDVPSADMIVQNSYPLIIHAASGNSKGGLRLPALNKRIRKVTDEFTTGKCLHLSGSNKVEASRVIVVTLWRKVADALNKARREGKLKGCLCVIPFAKKSVDTLADYALHHIPLQTLLGEQQEEEEAQGEKEEVVVNGWGATSETILGKVLSLVRELGGVEPHVVAGRLKVPLWKVSRVARRLKDKGVIKVAMNIPDLRSVKRANAAFYLDCEKLTALHDTVMNMVWERNVELGGRSRDFSFEHKGRTWHTDGLLENIGDSYILEVVAGEYGERVIEQLQAYSTQIGHTRIRGVIVVMLNQDCLEKIREEAKGNGMVIPETGLMVLTMLRSSDEKKQLENLLLGGKPMAYHRNPTSSQR